MKYNVSIKSPVEHKADHWIVISHGASSSQLKEIEKSSSISITDFINSELSCSKALQHASLYQCLSNSQADNAQWLSIIKVDDKKNNTAQLAHIGHAIADIVASKKSKKVLIFAEDIQSATSKQGGVYQSLVTYIEDKRYKFTQCKSDDKQESPLKSICFYQSNDKQVSNIKDQIHAGQSIAHGMNLTKDLANLPGNICTPSYLATQALSLKKSHGLDVEVLEEADMKKLGMGALLSVSAGSDQPAKLISMSYKGGAKNDKPVVIVGKGLTFDAGGISIKPAAAMDEMKYDMCGGASVFGVMMAIAEMKLKINVVGVVPSSENLINGKANKPGDIVTSMSGKTIEILNTDAEGRLILADALTYVKKYDPAVVIDLATLTGAIIIALGHKAHGVFANDKKLAKALLEAGDQSNDRGWEMPIWSEYESQLKSNFADLANIGGRPAGSITAACFLHHFTRDYRWAHIDIAGTAWKSGSAKGATARPVPLLMSFLKNHSQKNV